MRTPRYVPRHAKPALHPTRTTVSTGLTAALLPLCLASPALATEASTSPAAAATSTATIEGSSPSPAPSSTTTPAPTPAKATTVLRISGPAGSVAPGSHAIGVRLLADDKPVKDGYVRVERKTASGSWEYVGRLLTDRDGLGVGKFSFAKTTRLRAVYQGAATRTAGTSRELAVSVVDFRTRAVRVAAAQKGKPYRYGSTGPSSFDCSGLMVYTFKQVGKTLPRTSRQQLNATRRISKAEMRPGDLVFTKRGTGIGHVGVYAGDGNFWVAPKSGDVVKLQRIYTNEYLVGRVD